MTDTGPEADRTDSPGSSPWSVTLPPSGATDSNGTGPTIGSVPAADSAAGTDTEPGTGLFAPSALIDGTITSSGTSNGAGSAGTTSSGSPATASSALPSASALGLVDRSSAPTDESTDRSTDTVDRSSRSTDEPRYRASRARGTSRDDSSADRPFDGSAEPGAMSPPATVTSGAAGTSPVAAAAPAASPVWGRGSTTIADEVVEKVAGIAARTIPGVYALGGDVSRALSGLKERIGLGEATAARGVRVELTGTRAVVHLTIVVEYGHNVMEVAHAVRASVITGVETMLAIDVTEVNIVVDDVHVPDDD